MKNLYAIIILAVTIFFSGCKKDAVNSDYDRSYSAWSNFKNSSNNSYSYTEYSGSIFGGYHETKITVKSGTVTSREFLSGVYKPNSNVLTITKTWIENAGSLNTHGNEGFDLLTLDQVYDKAKTVWLKADKKQNDIYFENKNNGLISSAGFVPKGCQDDCFNGVSIKNINPL
ncbi:MAG: hypothetical protein V5804_05250 [Mucilaginibacter sp.]|uniref:hypothetical protein n=1 Tax=Mucilaginibacter sp. TaxID=1882438 RepID=UPI0034E5ED15